MGCYGLGTVQAWNTRRREDGCGEDSEARGLDWEDCTAVGQHSGGAGRREARQCRGRERFRSVRTVSAADDFRRRRKQGPGGRRRGGLRVRAASAALPLRARSLPQPGPRETRSRCRRAPQRSARRRRRCAGEAGRQRWLRAAVHRSAFLCLLPAGPERSRCPAVQPQDG